MLSRPSFTAELKVFRANLKLPRKPGDPGPLGLGNRNSADLQLLDRWIKYDRPDADADYIWHKLKKPRPHADPAAFIKAVLAARRSAQATVNRTFGVTWRRGKIPGFNDEWRAVVASLTKRLIKPPLSAKQLDAILDETAERYRERYHDLRQFYFGFADQAKFEPSRKDQRAKDKKRGTRVPRVFGEIMRDYFKQNFGGSFETEIACLTEIAFPGDQEFKRNDAIRLRRPTTARARSRPE